MHDPSSLGILGDRQLLRQALVNLVDNALKYGSPGQRIQLGAERHGASVRLYVADEGPGVPESERARIFEPYERLVRDQTSERTGTGLGLAVVRHIVQVCNGRVWLDDSPSRGTRVILELPIAELARAGCARAGARVSTILLVEDNRAYAETLKSNLEREGYEVTVAATGLAGLEAAKKDTPDLIILDLMLPAMNGFTVLQRLRDEGHETPVLIMTALGTEEEKLRGFGLGADDYVVKPCGLLEILARVRALLEAREHRAGRAALGDPRRGSHDRFWRETRPSRSDRDHAAAQGIRPARRAHPTPRPHRVARGTAARSVGLRRRHRKPNGRDAPRRSPRATRRRSSGAPVHRDGAPGGLSAGRVGAGADPSELVCPDLCPFPNCCNRTVRQRRGCPWQVVNAFGNGHERGGKRALNGDPLGTLGQHNRYVLRRGIAPQMFGSGLPSWLRPRCATYCPA